MQYVSARLLAVGFTAFLAGALPLGGSRLVADPEIPEHSLTGTNASLDGRRPFPDDNPWNRDVSQDPVDPNSDRIVSAIGAERTVVPDFGNYFSGKPYVVVSGDTPKVPVSFTIAAESDPGPYPIPPNPPIQSDSDHHILVVDKDNWKLYELLEASRSGNGWHAYCGAIFDLNSNKMRPERWTSSDAAGLPMFPGLVRYDEVYEQKAIRHALRFSVPSTRRAYIYPARHFASGNSSPNLPPMGARFRLKADYDISGFSEPARVILQALKTYGMFVADHGSAWYLSGPPDRRWDNDVLRTLRRVRGRDFELVRMDEVSEGD